MALPDLSRHTRIGMDTETTGLSARDVPVGISLALPNGERHYLRWGHQQGGNNCSLTDVVRWARRELKDPKRDICFLNGVFDLRMMAAVGVNVKGEMHDAGIMAALNNEYEPSYKLGDLGRKYLGRGKSDEELNLACAKAFGGKPTRDAQAGNYWRISGDVVEEYAKDDADLALGLCDKFAPRMVELDLTRIYEVERALIPVLVRMFQAGVKVDLDAAVKTRKKLDREASKLDKEWTALYGIDHTVKKEMIALFDREGIPYPMTAPSKRFPNGQPSFTKEVLEEMDHPIGLHLRRLRQLRHYSGTFINNYLLENADSEGMIHPQFHSVKSDFGGTITGRFSSSGGLNAQNIPARDEEWAHVIRALFIPKTPDHQWMKCDYSQIEYRFFAHYAGGQLQQAYIDNPLIDFHQMVAEMTGLKRGHAKSINFGILYGMGEAKTARQLGVSRAEAKKLLAAYNKRVPEAKDLYHSAMNRANRRGYIRTWGGRISRFQQLKGKRVFMGTHKSLNKLLQGSAADLIKMAMLEVDKILDYDDNIMHLTVHDELDFSVQKGAEGIKFSKQVKEIMQSFKIDVPIICEPELGPNWGSTKKVVY